MIYILSGASRSGKTLVAKQILEEHGIPYLSLDWLVMGFTNGIPEYGVHDKLFPDEIAERSWSFFKAMLESMLGTDEDCLVEGEAILPELIAGLKEKYSDQLKICFLGYTDIPVAEKVRLVKNNSQGDTDWLTNENDDYIIDHVSNMIAHSKKMKKSCEKFKLRYFDTGENFNDTIKEVKAYLLN